LVGGIRDHKLVIPDAFDIPDRNDLKCGFLCIGEAVIEAKFDANLLRQCCTIKLCM
jgi:hypothetical protein